MTLCHIQNICFPLFVLGLASFLSTTQSNSSIRRVAPAQQSTYLSTLALSKRFLCLINCCIHNPCSSRDLKSFIDPNSRTLTAPLPVSRHCMQKSILYQESTPGTTKVKSYSGRFRTPDVDSKPTETHLASLTLAYEPCMFAPFYLCQMFSEPETLHSTPRRGIGRNPVRYMDRREVRRVLSLTISRLK